MLVSVANERKKRKGREMFSGGFLKGKLRIHKSTWFSWIRLERQMRNFELCFLGTITPCGQVNLLHHLFQLQRGNDSVANHFRRAVTLLPSSYFSFYIIGITIIITLIFTEYLLCARGWHDALYVFAVLNLTAALWTRCPLFLHEKSSYGAFTCSTN